MNKLRQLVLNDANHYINIFDTADTDALILLIQEFHKNGTDKNISAVRTMLDKLLNNYISELAH